MPRWLPPVRAEDATPLLDLLHSAFIVASLFKYFIDFFCEMSRIGFIPPSIASSIVVTAIQTLIAHWYFAHKIYISSGKNWWVTGPIVLLAFLRLYLRIHGCLNSGPNSRLKSAKTFRWTSSRWVRFVPRGMREITLRVEVDVWCVLRGAEIYGMLKEWGVEKMPYENGSATEKGGHWSRYGERGFGLFCVLAT
ncbi:hypothetical protein B0H14DRAFT_3656458 [Mycena olivaceomarginata]|nr:hypothetical protein B0H14DRAFT_3656458 [Mycena olivaceomarginata]